MPAIKTGLTDLFDMDNFFSDKFFENWNNWKLGKFPAANIEEKDKEYMMEMAVPGLQKEDFHVEVKNGMLEVYVEKEDEKKEEKKNFTRMEYNYDSFFRTFNLPDNVVGDEIQATYKDGLLRVVLPKTEEAQNSPVNEIPVL